MLWKRTQFPSVLPTTSGYGVLDSRFVDFWVFFDSRLFLKLIKIDKILKEPVRVSHSPGSWKNFWERFIRNGILLVKLLLGFILITT